MNNTEKLYDDKIKPMLDHIKEICRQNRIPFYAQFFVENEDAILTAGTTFVPTTAPEDRSNVDIDIANTIGLLISVRDSYGNFNKLINKFINEHPKEFTKALQSYLEMNPAPHA